MKQPLVFYVDTPLISVEELVESFPLRQTQALIVVLSEVDAWLGLAKEKIGMSAVKGMDAHSAWLASVDNYLEIIGEAIDDEEPELIACRLTADDALYDALEFLIDDCPSDDEISDSVKNKAMAKLLVSLSVFWVDHVRHQLIRLLSQISGDGETLTILHRQETLTKISCR